jgi:hypothetical protein
MNRTAASLVPAAVPFVPFVPAGTTGPPAST